MSNDLPLHFDPARALRVIKSVNNGRDKTGGLPYDHLTRCLISYGDGAVV